MSIENKYALTTEDVGLLYFYNDAMNANVTLEEFATIVQVFGVGDYVTIKPHLEVLFKRFKDTGYQLTRIITDYTKEIKEDKRYLVLAKLLAAIRIMIVQNTFPSTPIGQFSKLLSKFHICNSASKTMKLLNVYLDRYYYLTAQMLVNTGEIVVEEEDDVVEEKAEEAVKATAADNATCVVTKPGVTLRQPSETPDQPRGKQHMSYQQRKEAQQKQAQPSVVFEEVNKEPNSSEEEPNTEDGSEAIHEQIRLFSLRYSITTSKHTSNPVTRTFIMDVEALELIDMKSFRESVAFRGINHLIKPETNAIIQSHAADGFISRKRVRGGKGYVYKFVFDGGMKYLPTDYECIEGDADKTLGDFWNANM